MIDLLICPASKALGKGEIPLAISDGKLVCGENTYPVDKFGIPNLRLPFDQDEVTSYDDILADFVKGAPDTQKILEVNKLSKENVTNKIVLLGGTGGGTDIDWILGLGPKLLICLDYSPHITTFFEQYTDLDNIAFVMGDICDLPFRGDSFDLIISQGIIHHTRSPEMAFSEQARALSLDGILSIGNLYSRNLHNHFVSMYRHKYRLDELPREEAKKFIKRNSLIYYWMAKLGISRLHRRFHIPGILHYASVEPRSFLYHFNNATDFYMPYYRHQISENEVKYWCNRLALDFFRSPKGYRITKT